MPLPRFQRLPPERQASILRVAREHFARDGREGASFNQILADAALPKTSAYQYFDGKEDLAGAVLAEVNARLLAVLGPWSVTHAAPAFWKQLKACNRRLREHMIAHPDDFACLRSLGLDQPTAADLAWFGAMIDNGVALSIIRGCPDRALLLAATMGFFRGVDAWALDALARGSAAKMDHAWALLARLWGAAK
ncbi:MAG: TetR/AcrR family transcriptional regulator [Myxococcales bacterium]|nr:TetR/AcrR family transcriptional regulator [Myxococcales bacterium]